MSTFAELGRCRCQIHSITGNGTRSRPTITPTIGFSASADAERIYKAIRGAGTDENEIINVLARRNNFERQKIAVAYENQYEESLRDALKGDTSGEFKEILLELLLDTAQLYAASLHRAMKGLGTKESDLIEILSQLRNEEMKAVVQAYSSDGTKCLLSDLESELSGSFLDAIKILVTQELDEVPLTVLKAVANEGVQTVCNKEQASLDAQSLLDCGSYRLGTNEETITKIICLRTQFQLSAIDKKYTEVSGRNLIDDLKSEFSGDIGHLVTNIARYAIDRFNFLAERIHDTISGCGTRDHELMRLLITRAELDLEDVKEAYERKYNVTMESAIKGDTSGNYENTLLALMRSD